MELSAFMKRVLRGNWINNMYGMSKQKSHIKTNFITFSVCICMLIRVEEDFCVGERYWGMSIT